MLERLRRDIRVIFDRDPAAKLIRTVRGVGFALGEGDA